MIPINEIKKDYGIETALLVSISRLYFGTTAKQDVQNMIDSNRIDWTLFYQIITFHHVRPFIYDVIITEDLQVDALFLKQLKQVVIIMSAKNLHQFKFLQILLGDFEKENIKVIPYKGVTFANSYYKSASLRESVDLDFLIHRDDVPRIQQYFLNRKYDTNANVPKEYLSYFIRHFRDITFQTPGDKLNLWCTVELQWKLMLDHISDYPDFDFFITHLKKETINGNSIAKLETTYDFLAIVSNHFIKEQLCSFKYIIDIGCILKGKRDSIDWSIVENLMKKIEGKKIFFSGMKTVSDLLGIKLPIDDLGKGDNQRLIKNSLKFSLNKSSNTPIHFLAYSKSVLAYKDSIKGKTFFILKTFFASTIPNITDINTFRLGHFWLPVLFILRPIRLIKKFLF